MSHLPLRAGHAAIAISAKPLSSVVVAPSRGIGAAIAKRLAAEGADVAITFEKSADAAAEVVRAIEKTGRRAVAILADSASAADVRASVEKTVAALGGIDILVNNAGILRFDELTKLTLADVDALLDVNVRAPIVASQAAIPHLGAGGRIINIGSYFAERVPAPGLHVYAATKSALLAFTKGLARELGPRGVTVNVIQPGSIDTDMNPAHGPVSDLLRTFIPVGKYGTPDDIGNAVAFLASPGAQYVTGTTLTVDGGANA